MTKCYKTKAREELTLYLSFVIVTMFTDSLLSPWYRPIQRLLAIFFFFFLSRKYYNNKITRLTINNDVKYRFDLFI